MSGFTKVITIVGSVRIFNMYIGFLRHFMLICQLLDYEVTNGKMISVILREVRKVLMAHYILHPVPFLQSVCTSVHN
jgi:hypothetical protein